MQKDPVARLLSSREQSISPPLQPGAEHFAAPLAYVYIYGRQKEVSAIFGTQSKYSKRKRFSDPAPDACVAAINIIEQQ